MKTLFSLLFFIFGLICFFGGFFVSWFPPSTIYLGYSLIAVGLFGLICPADLQNMRVMYVFLIWWATGALLTTMLFIPMSLIAMFSTLPIHLPLMGLACRVAMRDNSGKHSAKPFYVTAFFLALILPHLLVVHIQKPYPQVPERIEMSADLIENKQPIFIDDSSMWHQDTVQPPFNRSPVEYRLNKSAAVIGLDFGKLKDEEKIISEQLFSTYQQALSYANQKELPVIPSVQMIDHKAKVVGDQLYAAIEEYMQSEAEMLGGGKAHFLTELLTKLLDADDDSQGCMEAAAYIAAGLHLGGNELPDLPPAVDKLRKKYEAEYLSQPIKCKPVGFYTESENLKQIFQQDRFYQTSLPLDGVIALAKIMVNNPDLRKQYRLILSLYSRMTNPPSRFSVDDVAEYAEHFDNSTALKEQMQALKKWGILCERGAGRDSGEGEICIQFLPHSTSKENQLFAKLYNYSSELPQHNIMNRLIRAIRSGELDLTPTTDSGWYDYQIHALETLLVTEKGQESDKLLLTEDYKKRLIDAFKTILTKKRELHVKHVELIVTLGMSLGERYFTISPDVHIEPVATYYLRTARGFRFLHDSLKPILGEQALEEIKVSDDKSVLSALENMTSLYYGLYLRACDDIGMKPEFLPEEMSETQVIQAKQQAENWLTEYKTEPFCTKDVRYIVPALSNQNRTQARYWMVVGVKLLKIRAEYVKRPQVQILDPETKEVIQDIPTDFESGHINGTYLEYKFTPEEYFLPVEVFAEATGSADPLTRDEFRKLCDKHKNKEEIVAAIELRAIRKISMPVIIAVTVPTIIIISVALLSFIKKKQKASV